MPPITVLSITGWCRNGSTIVGNLLNEVDGFVHVGELGFLWKNAYGGGSNTQCGCGRDLTACPIWARVLAAAAPPGAAPADHARAAQRHQAAALRTRHTWRVLGGGAGGDDRAAYAGTLARTYRAIADATGARVIVDSTKLPAEAALLAEVDGIAPIYLHLVRDPRAAAHSWSKQKDYIHPMSPARSAAYWVGFNLASHAIARRHPERSLIVRYEDFIQAPAATIAGLIARCGGDPAHNPVHGRRAELRPNHTVTGNPDRFRTGSVEIRATDAAWHAELPRAATLTTLALTWPLLAYYGYPVRAWPQPAPPVPTPVRFAAPEARDGSRTHA